MKTPLSLLFAAFAIGCVPEPTDSDPDTGTDTEVDTSDADTNDVDTDDVGTDDVDTDDADTDDVDTEPDTDADTTPVPRTTLNLQFCPSTVTAPGAYQGSLGSNLNDIASASCIGATPGRDGAVRVELAPGETVSATFNVEFGDAILYILDSCPVVSSCLDGSDASSSSPETVEWTNDGSQTNPVYIVLDTAELDNNGSFVLDVDIIEI